jgi:hypothetical protein
VIFNTRFVLGVILKRSSILCPTTHAILLSEQSTVVLDLIAGLNFKFPKK